MPKKIHTNPKAEAARERKEEVKKTKKAAEEKAKEDAKWVDEGSTSGEKRRAEKAIEAAEAARRRAEKKALAAKEEEAAASISAKSKGLTNAEKITRAQILRQQEELMEQRRLEAERAKMEAKKLAPQIEPQENLNRQASDELAKDIEQFGIGNVIHASGIDTTLQSLSGGALSSSSSTSTAGTIDQHPEKRMKSAFAEYEDRMMPIVRSENPRLKLSQYKEMIFKSWQKSPDNPFNKRKMQEASLLESTDAWKYGNFRE